MGRYPSLACLPSPKSSRSGRRRPVYSFMEIALMAVTYSLRVAGLMFCLAGPLAACVSAQATGWQVKRRDAATSSSPTNSIIRRVSDELPLPPPDSATSSTASSAESSVPGLAADGGQEWREYDLRPFTNLNPGASKPEQAIVDWILRETGTELWFGEPAGVLSASRERLKVYHTQSTQAIVDEVGRRFVRPGSERYTFGVRMMTVASANWRAKALPKLRSVTTQTAGVEAWLMSREDAAVVLADLRRRSDYREHSSPNLVLTNGSAHEINRRRPLAYVRGASGIVGGVNTNGFEMGQVDEGFTLSVSPLLSLDQKTVDAVVHLDTTQVERLTDVTINTPTPGNPRQTARVQVPQTSAWRLHERFHWPAAEVLLISCGMVAAPNLETNNYFPLSNLPLPNLGNRPPRVDALLVLDFKGPTGELNAPETPSATASQPNYRGRY